MKQTIKQTIKHANNETVKHKRTKHDTRNKTKQAQTHYETRDEAEENN